MAFTIISENLIAHTADGGLFEADRSTWIGYVDSSYINYSRDNSDPYQGLFSCKVDILNSFTSDRNRIYVWAAVFQNAGNTRKRYMIEFYIKNIDLFDQNSELKWAKSGASVSGVTPLEYDFSNPNQWNRVRLFYDGGNGLVRFRFYFSSDDTNDTGSFLIDQIRAYEILEDDDPCQIAVDHRQTVITDETNGQGNGSIQVTILNPDNLNLGVYLSPPGNTSIVPIGSDSIINYTFNGLSSWFRNLFVTNTEPGGCNYSFPFRINNVLVGPLEINVITTNETLLDAEDGSIRIQTFLGTEPYEFSIDGGTTFTSNSTFTNLAPGIYQVVARDADGTELIELVEIFPGPLNFSAQYLSMNPIRFTRVATASQSQPNYRIHADVMVEKELGTGTFQSVLQVEQRPNAQGQTTFNIRQAFRGLFSPSPPAQNQSDIERITNQFVIAKVSFGDVYDGQDTPVNVQESSPFMVILGGVEKRLLPGFNFTEWYRNFSAPTQPTQVRFLTLAPRKRVVDATQEDYLTFITPIGWQGFEVKAWIFYEDGTSTDGFVVIKPLFSAPKGTMSRIPTGPANSGVLDVDPTKRVVSYRLILEYDIFLNSEIREYEVSYKNTKYHRYYLFQNSLGSFDVFRTTGKKEIKARIRTREIRKYLPPDFSETDAEFQNFDSTNRRTTDISTGFLLDTRTVDWFQDFAMSPQIYDITDGRRVPVTVEVPTFKIAKDKEYQHYVRFKVKETYQNNLYTPDSLR